MTTIFLSGSRKLNRINDNIRKRLKNMVDNEFLIVLGDANGADKALQKYFADLQYQSVLVYCSGQKCRNNIGGWELQNISVDPKIKGREFYAEKDRKMAEVADYGLVLWDGKSSGSIANVMELLKKNKKSLIYFSPEKKFYSISNIEEFKELLNKCDNEIKKVIYNKLSLNSSLRELERKKQFSLSF